MLERKTGTRSQRALEAYENLKNPEKFQHEVPTKNPSRLSNRGKAIGGILVLIVSTGITVPVVIITSNNGNTTTTTGNNKLNLQWHHRTLAQTHQSTQVCPQGFSVQTSTLLLIPPIRISNRPSLPHPPKR